MLRAWICSEPSSAWPRDKIESEYSKREDSESYYYFPPSSINSPSSPCILDKIVRQTASGWILLPRERGLGQVGCSLGPLHKTAAGKEELGRCFLNDTGGCQVWLEEVQLSIANSDCLNLDLLYLNDVEEDCASTIARLNCSGVRKEKVQSLPHGKMAKTNKRKSSCF